MKDQWAPADGKSVTVTFGKLPPNVTVTESGRNFVPCTRMSRWERLRVGGALSHFCHCPFCQGFPTAI